MSQGIASSPQYHVWVSASAGTGKTKVLVDRLIHLLLEGFAPETILCLTFTRIAAAEMKERVLCLLQKDYPALYMNVLEKPLRIQTIHSFCQDLLKDQGSFTVLEENDIKRLLQKAKENLYTLQTDSLVFLAKTMSEARFDELLEALLSNPTLYLKWKERYGSIDAYKTRLDLILGLQDLPLDVSEDFYTLCLTQKGDIRKKLPPDLQKIAQDAYNHRIYMIHQETAQQTLHFIRVAETVFQEYGRLKEEQGCLDFYDLIQKAKTVPLKISLSHILVDEAQDTSDDQWDILHRLVETFIIGNPQNTFFVVGDHKQSIYSFQGAKPEKFIELPHYFEKKLNPFKYVSLNLSYRTASAVLEIVDKTFEQLGVQFTSHVSARENAPGKVAAWPLTKKMDHELPPWGLIEEGQSFVTTEQEHAKALAIHIAELLKSPVILPSTGQAVRPEDVLVLFQKRSNLMHELEDALTAQNIPSSGMDRLLLNEQIIIKDLLALGHFALLPEDDYTLACILKGPFVGATEKELYALCHERGGFLWGRVENPFLLHLITQKNLSPFDFYAPIIRDMDFGDSQTLDAFLTYCLSYEEKEIPTLRGFLEWFRLFDPYVKRTSKECVRFMTIHASKGLQAPIVILADATEKPSLRHDVFLVDETLWLIKPSLETPFIQGIKETMLTKLKEEHLRLLYVAMTRSQDQLYVAGIEKEGVWYEPIVKALEDCDDCQPQKYGIYQNTPPVPPVPPVLPEHLEPYFEAPLHTLTKRGIALHRYLENMPSIDKNCPEKDLLERLLSKFPEFFEGEPEVSIATPEGLKRMDRLIVKKDEIWIVEYKTHEIIPEDITSIVQQVLDYKKYVEEYHAEHTRFLYTKYRVRCFIFWITQEFVQEV